MKVSISVLLLFFFAFSIFLLGCKELDSRQQAEAEAVDSVSVMGTEEADCFQSADLICEEGLIFARLGGFLADVYLTDLPEGATQDSMENGNGYEWISRTLHLEKGKLVVEGEFIDERVSNDTILSNSRINRLRIETPYFRTAENIRVGSSLKDIRTAYANSEWFATPLPEYNAIQLLSPGSHIVYVLADPDPNFKFSQFTEELPAEQLPDEAQVAMIVVM